MNKFDIGRLEGMTIVDIPGGIEKDGRKIRFVFSDGRTYFFQHIQECCEDVRIADVSGDWRDLIGSPLTLSAEVVSENRDACMTWTFYTFATIKGYVTVRWLGESNGYYSERVDHGWLSSGPENSSTPNT